VDFGAIMCRLSGNVKFIAAGVFRAKFESIRKTEILKAISKILFNTFFLFAPLRLCGSLKVSRLRSKAAKKA